MKILLVNTRHFFGGGDSTYTFALANLLRMKGHEISFFGMQGEKNIPDNNADLFVSHIDFRALNARKTLSSGLRVLSRSIYSSEARQKFSMLLERIQPDIVHLQNIHAHITPSIIWEAKKRNIPVVWTLHDYKIICPNSHFYIDNSYQICEACQGGKFWHAITNQCKKNSVLASGMASVEAYAHRILRVNEKVDAFLCPSTFLRSKFIQNGYPERKTYHVPLFLDKEQDFSIEDEGYLLFLGKLEPLKGVLQILEAAKRVPSVHIKLAGTVDDAFLRLVMQNMPKNVEYVGFHTGSSLNDLRNKSRAFLIPSQWYENQPYSILEAFSIGKPVIATNIGGMKELVRENKHGQLVTLNDVDGLAKAMLYFAKNKNIARELGENAYQYLKTHHSKELHYERIMRVYREYS